MKKLLTISFFMFCLNCCCSASCVELIKEFYTAYMNNILQNNRENTALCDKYFTPGLQEKVYRFTSATGANAIIRAQDMNEDAIETLSVTELDGDWYLVKYLWKKGDESTAEMIPVRASKVGDLCKIDFITPMWNGAEYGDKLLECRFCDITAIDQRSELEFVKSFYALYLSDYCRISDDMIRNLEALREQNLTDNVLVQFKRAETEYLEDGEYGYDLLINNIVFDCKWCESVEFSSLEKNVFQISYKDNYEEIKIKVGVIREGNSFKIDKILK